MAGSRKQAKTISGQGKWQALSRLKPFLMATKTRHPPSDGARSLLDCRSSNRK